MRFDTQGYPIVNWPTESDIMEFAEILFQGSSSHILIYCVDLHVTLSCLNEFNW